MLDRCRVSMKRIQVALIHVAVGCALLAVSGCSETSPMEARLVGHWRLQGASWSSRLDFRGDATCESVTQGLEERPFRTADAIVVQPCRWETLSTDRRSGRVRLSNVDPGPANPREYEIRFVGDDELTMRLVPGRSTSTFRRIER